MGFFDNLKQSIMEATQDLTTKVNQFKNNDFAEASMAVCALVAAADGSIDREERQKTASFIMNNSTLQIFDTEDLKERFKKYCDKLETDFDFGKIEAIQAVSKLKSKEDQARAVIQVGIIIGGADGDFDPDEKAVLAESCRAVGINPNDFDLLPQQTSASAPSSGGNSGFLL